jgi:DNA-binding MarR family transcriptional regulator
MAEPIIYNQLKNNFSQISNHALLDTNLSAKAYKLYAYMCYRIGLSQSWQFNTTEILKHFKEGESAMRTAFNELIKAGFLERKRIRNAKGIFERTDYVIYAEPVNATSVPHVENPRVEKPGVEIPKVDSPFVEKPRAENRTYNNKEGNNKDKNNRSLSLEEMKNFWKELKERENYDFEFDVKNFFDWCSDEDLKIGWKNVMKSWAKKPENQIKQIKPSLAHSPSLVEESAEIKKLRGDIKFVLGNAGNPSAGIVLAAKPIVKVGEEFILKTSEPRDMQFQALLTRLKIKIEVK